MTDQRSQTAKESKGFRNRLKKMFGRVSQSTPPNPSNSPPAVVAPPAVVVSPPTVSAPPADLVPTVPMMTTDLVEAAKLRAKYTHFRILVIGRANAGKTTLLKRVCNTKEDPVYSQINPTSKRGIHNVHDEFSFMSNPQFIFHDSPGFEAGSEQELQDVHSFIQEKAKANEVKDQIHAIWFCFGPDVSRPLLELEQKFFDEKHCGNVPVVAIFTKFDDLITQVYDRNKEDEENREVACATLKEKFEKPLKGYKSSPRAYVQVESIEKDEGNHQEQVGELIKQTAASIDNLALKMLFVTVQQNNLEVCIEYAVNKFIFEDTSTVVHFFLNCRNLSAQMNKV
ncbi:hypothetical protein F5887DRAFT_1101757 [Amanita rubescens]|nr:hypothetical protein F5887DRAFT_1101757 [Amanita rubescens]